MGYWLVLVLLLSSGNGASSGNGVPQPDSEYEKAITACTMMLFGDALEKKTLGLDQTGHGAAYDAFEEQCRVALGALIQQ